MVSDVASGACVLVCAVIVTGAGAQFTAVPAVSTA
jgi:hypothetical protein